MSIVRPSTGDWVRSTTGIKAGLFGQTSIPATPEA